MEPKIADRLLLSRNLSRMVLGNAQQNERRGRSYEKRGSKRPYRQKFDEYLNPLKSEAGIKIADYLTGWAFQK